jgi:hypothetical protein
MSLPYDSLEPVWKPPATIPLEEAILCADCDMISRAKDRRCRVCESEAVVSIARLLNHLSCGDELRVSLP